MPEKPYFETIAAPIQSGPPIPSPSTPDVPFSRLPVEDYEEEDVEEGSLGEDVEDTQTDADGTPVSFVTQTETPEFIVFGGPPPEPAMEQKKLWIPVRDILQKSQFFGLFNLFRCHPCCLHEGRKNPRTQGFDAVFKVLPLLLLLVQVVIPVALLRGSLETHPEVIPVCHRGGDPNRRILMVAVGLVYTVRMPLLWAEKMVLTAWDPDPRLTKLVEPNSVIAWWGLLDYVMAVPYEFMLYIFNLWIVYQSTAAIDMVLNALAFEFVMKIDNEYKEMYFKMGSNSFAKHGAQDEAETICDPLTMNVIYSRLYKNDGHAIDPESSTLCAGLCSSLFENDCCQCLFDFVRKVVFFASYIVAGAALVASVSAVTIGYVCKA